MNGKLQFYALASLMAPGDSVCLRGLPRFDSSENMAIESKNPCNYQNSESPLKTTPFFIVFSTTSAMAFSILFGQLTGRQ
jgi:hypothetical protein